MCDFSRLSRQWWKHPLLCLGTVVLFFTPSFHWRVFYSKTFFLLNPEYPLWEFKPSPHGNQSVIGHGHHISNRLWNPRFILRLYTAAPAVGFARSLFSGCKEVAVAPGLEWCQLWSYGTSLILNAPSALCVQLHTEAAWTWRCLVLTQQRLQSLSRVGIVCLPLYSPQWGRMTTRPNVEIWSGFDTDARFIFWIYTSGIHCRRLLLLGFVNRIEGTLLWEMQCLTVMLRAGSLEMRMLVVQ